MRTKFTKKSIKNAKNNFENIKKSLRGLYQIINMNLADDKFQYKAALDNIEELYENFLELLSNEYGLRKLIKLIRTDEIDTEFNLDMIKPKVKKQKNLYD